MSEAEYITPTTWEECARHVEEALMVAPAQYTEVEAAQIKATLSTLTVAQLKERFDGHGVSWRWFGGMRKEAIITHLIAGRYTNLDGHPRPPVDQSLLVRREAAR